MPSQAQRLHTEQELLQERVGFSGAYMAVQYLRTHIENQPEAVTTHTLDALTKVITSPRFETKKQVLFLFKEAAQALAALAMMPEISLSERPIPILQDIVLSASGARARAVGTVLGSLPINFSVASPSSQTLSPPLTLSFKDLVLRFNPPNGTHPLWQGRSLLLPLENKQVGVIKFATSDHNIQELAQEIYWMHHLKASSTFTENQCHIPLPLKIDGHSGLFQVEGTLPEPLPPNLEKGICIAFLTHNHYFAYPNEGVQTLSQEKIKSVFFKNARALGQVTGMGIFHTALIPLFHNRVQQGRRNDNGAYLWEHGGRLDQWLDSCRYPNFSFSGIRDFEHLVPGTGSGKTGHYIGEHLLSFILVMGSYFRNHDPGRKGWNKNNTPVDTQDLFNPVLFKELISGVCQDYFKGLVEHEMPRQLEEPLPELIDHLISTMGRDRDMEEILRVRDQNDMDDSRYQAFLRKRGISSPPPKGETDITLLTGPHLGGFNQSISVPGLVDFLFCFSALCVSYCFLKENKLKAGVK